MQSSISANDDADENKTIGQSKKRWIGLSFLLHNLKLNIILCLSIRKV